LACAAGGLAGCSREDWASLASVVEVFRGDAPKGEVWEQWLKRGWARPARHFTPVGNNVQCRLCPNGCLLEPEDRGRCRGRVHKDGTLHTLSYGNACTLHIDPVEKKPLFHFLPGTATFSFAASGCGFRCLNCQNWEISQAKPEEVKDPRGEPFHLDPRRMFGLTRNDYRRASLFPDDAVTLARFYQCPSISYTYSEPTVWFEYMYDTAQAARAAKLKNIWVTCGYIERQPLLELCRLIDGAHVDLKSFREEIYKELNSGRLAPILETIKTLRGEGVWIEIVNLVVPSYTDDFQMIGRMCDWLLKTVGPDVPLHFSRFYPQHKLTHLSPTPRDTLIEAREIARRAGLHYVYVGNILDVPDAATTFCPGCRKPVVERTHYTVHAVHLADGKCRFCGARIAGVWA
jgi:pyruvate formate lyase activating enzyme